MPRRYSQEEAQRIFALVADRQRLGTHSDDGLSLSELEEAARAAGLDPGLVAGAAAEIDAAPGIDRTLGGAPTEVVRRRRLPGDVDDDAWAQMVQTMRAEFGDAGMPSQIGRLREWTLVRSGSRRGTLTRLTVEPTAEGTRVTLTRSIRDAVFGLSIAAAVQWGMALLLGLSALVTADASLWVPALIMLGFGTVLGTAAQVGSRVWHRRQSARFEGVLDRLEVAGRDAPARPPEATGRLATDWLHDDAAPLDEPGARPSSRTRS